MENNNRFNEVVNLVKEIQLNAILSGWKYADVCLQMYNGEMSMGYIFQKSKNSKIVSDTFFVSYESTHMRKYNDILIKNITRYAKRNNLLTTMKKVA